MQVIIGGIFWVFWFWRSSMTLNFFWISLHVHLPSFLRNPWAFVNRYRIKHALLLIAFRVLIFGKILASFSFRVLLWIFVAYFSSIHWPITITARFFLTLFIFRLIIWNRAVFFLIGVRILWRTMLFFRQLLILAIFFAQVFLDLFLIRMPSRFLSDRFFCPCIRRVRLFIHPAFRIVNILWTG